MLKVLILMGLGGLLTSFAEYTFKYNLYDLLRDKVLALLRLFGVGKGKTDAKP